MNPSVRRVNTRSLPPNASVGHPGAVSGHCRACLMVRMALTIFIVALSLLFVTQPVQAELRKQDTNLLVISTTLWMVDWLQTKEIAANPAFTDQNVILGEKPSQSEVDGYFLVGIGLNVLITSALPEDMRDDFQYLFILAEIVAIAHNNAIGVRIKF